VSSTQQEEKSWKQYWSEAFGPLTRICRKPIQELGLPAWLPKALTYVLIIGTAVSLGYITAGANEFMASGDKLGVSYSALDFLGWLPIYGFAAAAVLCALRRADETLLGMAAGLFIFGVFRSSEMQGMPAGQYWFWGVVLALALTLIRPAWRVYRSLMVPIIVIVLTPFAMVGSAFPGIGQGIWDRMPFRDKSRVEAQAQPAVDDLM